MQISILTANIWFGTRLPEVIKYLNSIEADIIALQEVWHGNSVVRGSADSFERLKEALKNTHPYSFYTPTFQMRVDGGQADYGHAIFSKYPLQNTSSEFYRSQYREFDFTREDLFNQPRAFQKVDIDLGGKKVRIINNHGMWAPNQDDTIERHAMAELILKEANTHSPLIAVGDFNINLGSKTIDTILTKLKTACGAEIKTTINPTYSKPEVPESIVDFIFVTPEVKIIEATSPRVDISDHFPVFARLEI